MSLFPIFSPVARVTTLSLFGSATAFGPTVTAPASILAGDFMILADYAYNNDNLPTNVVPSGFTQIVTTGFEPADGARVTTSYKIATGSEGSTSITGMNNESEGKCLYVFRGNAPITSVSVSTPNAQGTGGDPTAQSVLAGSGTPPLIVFGVYYCSTTDGQNPLTPRSFSPAKDGEISNTTVQQLYLAYKIYNSSPQNTSIDMTDFPPAGINTLQSFYASMS